MRAIVVMVGLLLAGPALADLRKDQAAAAKGDAAAMYRLGQAYRLGQGVPADRAKALDYYRRAAARGHAVAADNYGLALFRDGRAREAAPYLEAAARRGDARAQYILGTMLFNGVAVPKDWVRAYALLTRSRQSGVTQAGTALAQMDRYLSPDQRRQGIAMAGQLASPTANVQSVASAPASRPASTATIVSGAWRVQLGAFGDSGNAQRLGERMAGRFPGQAIDYLRVGALTKVLVGRYPSRAAAVAACGATAPCVPVGP